MRRAAAGDCRKRFSVRASCWATAATRRPRSSTWCKAFVFLAGLPVLPFRPTDKIDIVNVDFVADAIATLHRKNSPQHDTYHLSSGDESQTFRELTESAGGGTAETRAGVFAGAGTAVCGIGEFSGESQGRGWTWRVADESLHAVSDVEHGVRQHAGDVGVGEASRCRFRSTVFRC